MLVLRNLSEFQLTTPLSQLCSFDLSWSFTKWLSNLILELKFPLQFEQWKTLPSWASKISILEGSSHRIHLSFGLIFASFYMILHSKDNRTLVISFYWNWCRAPSVIQFGNSQTFQWSCSQKYLTTFRTQNTCSLFSFDEISLVFGRQLNSKIPVNRENNALSAAAIIHLVYYKTNIGLVYIR